MFCIVQTITDYEVIRNGEQRNVRLNVNYSSFRLIQQSYNLQRNRISQLQQVYDIIQGSACVNDVFYDYNVIVLTS